MASEAAKSVAQEVLETIGKGERPNLTKIAIKKGYKPTTAKAGLVQKTKSYRNEIAPLVIRLEQERDAVIERMKKMRDKAKYR
ncbi:MAG: hypothetical protein ACREO5_01670, partial [Candidatus Binatia bacterium]